MTVDPNNQKIVFQGRVTRERPADDKAEKLKRLRKRGLISDKQSRRISGNKDA